MKQEDYVNYLKLQNSLDLQNLKTRKIHYKEEQGLIDPNQAQQLVNNINVNDNPLSNLDAKTQLREYLQKYIKNVYLVDKIINSPRLSTDLLNQIVLNFETSVEPRLKSLSVSNASLSTEKLVLLLENIGKQLLSSTMNIDINDKLSNLRNVFSSEFKKYDGEILGKDLPKLKQELIALNKQEFNVKRINPQVVNKNRNLQAKKVKTGNETPYDTIESIQKKIQDILMIDRSFDNLYKACKQIKSSIPTANIHYVSNDLIDDIMNNIPFKRRGELVKLLDIYYNQCLSYDGLDYESVKDVYINRITGNIDVTNDMPKQPTQQTPVKKLFTDDPMEGLDYGKTPKLSDEQLEEKETKELVDDLYQYSAEELDTFSVREYMQDKNFQVLTPKDVKSIVDSFITRLLEAEFQAKTGKGFKKTGTGISSNPKLLENEKMIHSKYFINTRKLGAGILDIRYAKNRHQIPIKQQHLSKDVHSIVNQLMGGQIDDNTYRKLPPIEKHLVRQLLPYFGKQKYDLNDDKSFHNRFEILKNEILSGNNNATMKRELKAYLLHGLNTGLINRSTFNTVLLELDL